MRMIARPAPFSALLLLPAVLMPAPARAQQPEPVATGAADGTRLTSAAADPSTPSTGSSNDGAKDKTPGSRWLRYGGTADFYFSHNFNDPFNSQNQMRMFDIRDDRGPHLGMIDLWAEGQRAPVGFRIDTNYGTTARLLNAFEPSHSRLWEHLEQVYVSANLNRSGSTFIDAGKWVTPAGEEMLAPPRIYTPAQLAGPTEMLHQNGVVDQWLYSRGLLYSFAMPFYHLGARVFHDFDPSGMNYVMVHVNRGWNAVGDPGHGPGFGISGSTMVGQKWMLMGNYLGGDESKMGMGGMGMGSGMSMGGSSYRSLFDFVGTYQASSRWAFTHNLDVGFQSGNAWYGLSSQARYRIDPKQYVAARAEVFRDDGGMMTGTDQTLTSLTLGYTYTFNRHAQTKVEYRHDFSGGARPFFGDTMSSFHAGQGTITIAAILSY